MPVIAVAGGSGQLGRSVVEALIAQGDVEVFILGRASKPELEKEIGATIIPVDYENPAGLAALLEKNNIDTVISTIGSWTGPANELSLIKAAEQSSTTKRFIPSLWGVPVTKEMVSYFPLLETKLVVMEALEASALEWTAVYNGYFSDYWVPNVKSYMKPMAFVVDMEANTAALPADGNTPVVFTHSTDVAAFIPGLVTQAKWQKATFIIGDKVTFKEFVDLAQKVKGPFTVHYDSAEKLERGEITELPGQKIMYDFLPKETLQSIFAAYGRLFLNGEYDLKVQPGETLNELFPGVKARTLEQLFSEAYGK